ncbi:hypothetical protein CXG81DRAFT_9567 [Caulochytrium protostelioides]|uniref:Geranylgeranyl transferase type-2 subunit beta n=1 Tax=Caulochytrium protostelioides TaxID=1555241 RepID=A0A4P9X011_9FUNG|nr:terpenoid cyclases/Protein prenyltransferase [Caulochytrium protostelioides]RKP03417.1 hypothetical protein CXG81DRAFT_9567 [Caulochytrium protostelioides]|eukprot:RKP03417.1 hypothetical protein CXG81DRAFT_9567 [Caulochytrium protostelioides]
MAQPEAAPAPLRSLLPDIHVQHIRQLDDHRDVLDYWHSEHLRLNGVYWGLTALATLRHMDTFVPADVIAFVLSCRDPQTGGFAGTPGHDPHLLYTVSAVQILVYYDALDRIDVAQTARWLAARQNRRTGAFTGDGFGEADVRFAYAALNALTLLLGPLQGSQWPAAWYTGENGALLIDTELTAHWIMACANADGGFGNEPGTESHAAHVFCAVNGLALLGCRHWLDADHVGAWLAERQLPCGGLNGRPEKLEDVCYSWWVCSALATLERLHWIDRDALIAFTLSGQDPDGGFADRPGNWPDVYHTCFGLTGLALLGHPDCEPIDARYCLPVSVTARHLGTLSVSAVS